MSINVSAPAPRVNSSMLSGFIGRKVILIGKYEGMEGNTLKLKAADDGMVSVALSCPAPQADVIEVQGTVSTPNSINAESTVAFSSNFGK